MCDFVILLHHQKQEFILPTQYSPVCVSKAVIPVHAPPPQQIQLSRNSVPQYILRHTSRARPHMLIIALVDNPLRSERRDGARWPSASQSHTIFIHNSGWRRCSSPEMLQMKPEHPCAGTYIALLAISAIYTLLALHVRLYSDVCAVVHRVNQLRCPESPCRAVW
jgi:hypothetical protein